MPGSEESAREIATFALGCFWKPDLLFSKLPGVVDVVVGYTGGRTAYPTYDEVCGGTTGHAEAVRITFDPSKVPFRKLLDVFWKNHDPTTQNAQGPDIGEQYRSAIFFHGAEQEKTAKESRDAYETFLTRRIVTAIEPAVAFYPAEAYHQKYLEKRGEESCPS